MTTGYAMAGVVGGFLGVAASAAAPENDLWLVRAALAVDGAAAAVRTVVHK